MDNDILDQHFREFFGGEVDADTTHPLWRGRWVNDSLTREDIMGDFCD